MSGEEFARWLALHEPAPDEQDTEEATCELDPVLVEAAALETQESYVTAADEVETLACGFWRWFQIWRAFWHLRWGK